MSGTTSLVKGSGLGEIVRKLAADLFDGTTTDIFTVSGGRVQITSLMITVEDAALDATADNVKWVANPTTGTSVDLCAVLDVASLEQGTLFSITGTLADALVGTSAGAVGAMTGMVIVNTGSIDLSSSGDSNDGNSALQSVVLTYVPLDEGARVDLT